MKAIVFGEVLWDVYPDKKSIGGAPLNFAAHFTKCGGDSWLISAIGNDALGKDTLKTVENFGVKTDYISVIDNKPTGLCKVTLNADLIPTYNLLYDVAYDYINTEKLKNLSGVLYFGTMSLRSQHNFNSLKALIKNCNFSEIFVDMNIRPPFYSEKTIGFALETATILKISEEELPIVIKSLNHYYSNIQSAVSLLSKFDNLKLILITLGDKGAFAYHKETKKSYQCDAKKVKALSTVGAGDSFSAAFLYKYLNKEKINDCLEYASKISAFVVSKKEAIPDY